MTITYFANPTRAAVGAMSAGRLGMIVTPRQGNRLPAGVTWCADNGCGPTRTGPLGAAYPGDEGYIAFLERLADKAGDCAFAVAPDVVGNARATLERSRPMLARIRALGYPVALAAQDGLEYLTDQIPWASFDVLFVGGSTDWKLGPGAAQLVALAKAHGKRVHLGRVNSAKRLRYAAEIGCDSADGTFLCFGPDRNLPRLMGWLDDLELNPPQARLAFI